MDRVFQLAAQYGPALKKIAAESGLTVGQVAGIKRRHREEWDKAIAMSGATDVADSPVAEEVKESANEDGSRTYQAKSTRLKTVEDLVRHMQIDLEAYEIVDQQFTQNEQVTKDEDGTITVTPYYRIYLRTRPKAGPSWVDAANQMLETALRERKMPAIVGIESRTLTGVWQLLDVADPHFGKYSWRGTTGYPDYDLNIARDHVLGSGIELIERGDLTFRPGLRTIAFLGDVFHYDTPHGTTTGGTPLERDGRMPKMVDVGTDTVLELIHASARTAPTRVLFVRGNHDEALTTFLQKTVFEIFRGDSRVTVDATHTHRKYAFHDGTLLGFTHGDKAKKRLPSLMPFEAKDYWPKATYYEWHTGHIHQQKMEQQNLGVIDGVIVRVAPAVCPPDDWHADNGFVGAPRGMESFFYRPGGGLAGSLLSSPGNALPALPQP